MEEIYIIYSGCRYDYDSSTVAIDFKFVEQEAIDEVARLTKLRVDIERVRGEVMKPSHENVMLESEIPTFHIIPKWVAGISEKDITKEMRDERTPEPRR